MRNMTKLFFLMILLIGGFGMEIFACHQGDLGATMKGHYHWSKNFGFTFRYTENSTIFTSITTHCDFYAQFIFHEYQYIAEEAAQGQGDRLMVLARLMGCSRESYPAFAAAIQMDYPSLFYQTSKVQPDLFLEKLKELVALTPTLEQTCRS